MLFSHGILKSELKEGEINYLINECYAFKKKKHDSSCRVMIKYKRRRVM